MHDEVLERRLREALRTEGASLPFTITPDELQRRLSLRRRARFSRTGVLLLAATVGVGLVGAGVAAGSWLDQRARNASPLPSSPIAQASLATPTQSNLAAATPDPSAVPTPPSGLPALDAFVAPFDPGEIVRAQSVGPATAPTAWSNGVGGPGSTSFAVVTEPGSYRVWLACVGAGVTLNVVRADPATAADAIPIACNADTTAHGIDLAAGDQVSIETSGPTSWRFALVAPGRAAPHATALTGDVARVAGRRLDNSPVSGDLASPDYTTVEGVPSPALVTYLNSRDAYRMAVACAGPGPLTYELRAPLGVSPPVGDGAALASVATTVECDGAAHLDVVRFPFVIGADVWITAPSGTAWKLAGAWQDPPIHMPADGNGWGLPIAVGPNLELTEAVNTWNGTFAKATRVRVVVTCYGGTSVDVTVREAETGDAVEGSAPCATGRAVMTVMPGDLTGRSFDITTATHGSPMWLSVALQQAIDR